MAKRPQVPPQTSDPHSRNSVSLALSSSRGKELVHQWAAAVDTANSSDGEGTGKGETVLCAQEPQGHAEAGRPLDRGKQGRGTGRIGHAPTLEAIRGIRLASAETGVDLSRALACVWVSCRSKGIPNRFDSICIPKADDLSKSPSDASTGPCESLHKVPRKRKGAKKKRRQTKEGCEADRRGVAGETRGEGRRELLFEAADWLRGRRGLLLLGGRGEGRRVRRRCSDFWSSWKSLRGAERSRWFFCGTSIRCSIGLPACGC
uniref:POP1 C-terminal domain-containing protein n=1 Tax=Ixodes ricinus TaxID=34613 RepID=A0A090X9V2_IXORI